MRTGRRPCGIGTQALGLALRGHRVVGTDVSARAVVRADGNCPSLQAGSTPSSVPTLRCPDRLAGFAAAEGFADIVWLMPEETGSFQPLLTARAVAVD